MTLLEVWFFRLYGNSRPRRFSVTNAEMAVLLLRTLAAVY
jgi:hypothetical protein